MTDFNYQEKLAEGAAAEDIARRFLAAHRAVARVEDVRAVKAWQVRDVDYIAHLTTGQRMNVEVKSDRWIGTTGNMLVEVCNVHFAGERGRAVRAGWTFFTQAAWLLLWCPTNERLYSLTTRALHEGLKRSAQSGTQTRLSASVTEGRWMTVNALIPLGAIRYHEYVQRGESFALVKQGDGA